MLSRHRGEDLVASLLAPTASLGAYPAVLHAVLAVLLALLTAKPAGLGAGLQRALTSRGSKAVWRERILPVASHTSAQSRLTLMQRESDLLGSSSPRQASAQAVQLWAQPPRLPEQT